MTLEFFLKVSAVVLIDLVFIAAIVGGVIGYMIFGQNEYLRKRR